MKKIKPEWLTTARAALDSFAEIPNEEWEKAILNLRHIHLKKNEYFIQAGSFPDKIACIVSGIFRVFYNTESGKEKILAIRFQRHPGEYSFLVRYPGT